MSFDKINIGVVIDSNNIATNGGSYSYYSALLSAIDKKVFNEKIIVRFINFDRKFNQKFNKKTINIYPVISKNTIYWFYSIIAKILSKLNIKLKFINNRNAYFKKVQLSINNIDIIYYLLPFQNDINYPYIITHWDLGHKTTFAFPELAMNDSFSFRDRYHRENLNKAFQIFVESEESLIELSHYERISELKIKIIPLFPSDVVHLESSKIDSKLILDKYDLIQNQFFFYPAQFWSHKNHINLLIAFKSYLNHFNACKLVLTGSDKGNLNHVVEVAKELGIFENIIFTGFVNNQEIFTFYKNCISVVMPTFLGPTNMPLIEAYELDCKIICSNLSGHKKLLKDNALYFSPNSSNEIYEAMIKIKDFQMPDRKKGVFTVENSISSIEDAFLSIINIRNTFGKINSRF